MNGNQDPGNGVPGNGAPGNRVPGNASGMEVPRLWIATLML